MLRRKETKKCLLLILLLIAVMPMTAIGSEFSKSNPRVVFVMPTFTNTVFWPINHSSFYTFFRLHEEDNQTYVTTNLDTLNTTIVPGWGISGGLGRFLDTCGGVLSQLIGNWTVIDDRDVDGGLLLSSNGTRNYDVVVCGFTEYVTLKEYMEYKQFVATGGTIVFDDACNFLAEVAYYPSNGTGYLSLVKGKGWAFNGTCAWRSVYHRWPEENVNWVGSEYWKFWIEQHYNGFIANTTHPLSEFICANYGSYINNSYIGWEENKLMNMTDTTIIGYWHFINPSDEPIEPIAAYQHSYCRGKVFHSGIIGSSILCKDCFAGTFLIGAIRMGLGLDAAHEMLYKDLYPVVPVVTANTATTTTSSNSTTIVVPKISIGILLMTVGLASIVSVSLIEFRERHRKDI